MANHKSAKKRIRQNVKKRAANRIAKVACRTAIKNTKNAIEQGNIDEAKNLIKIAEKTVSTATTKGLYHKNNASRKISRLYQMLRKANNK